MDAVRQQAIPTGAGPKAATGPEGAAAEKKAAEEKKLKKACTDFEAFFTYYLLKTMRETVPKSEFLGKAPGKDTYTMMLDQKIAESVSARGDGLGLKDVIFKQLNKIK